MRIVNRFTINAMTESSGWRIPADVQAVSFGRPPWGKRGYNENQVDDFLDRAVATIETRERLGR